MSPKTDPSLTPNFPPFRAFQIISDGEQMILIIDDDSEEGQSGFLLKYPFIKEFCINLRQDQIDFGTSCQRVLPRSESLEADISLVSDKCIYLKGHKDLMSILDFFKNQSIRDLFRIINRKIKERG